LKESAKPFSVTQWPQSLSDIHVVVSVK
jgi:hypothetical protein